jgi:hypothetical protein
MMVALLRGIKGGTKGEEGARMMMRRKRERHKERKRVSESESESGRGGDERERERESESQRTPANPFLVPLVALPASFFFFL